MNIEQIAIRFTDRPHQAPGDVPIDHHYRQRWWLPIIGPTSTCNLNHLATQTSNYDWHLTPARNLATAIGLGKGTGKHSPLIRSLAQTPASLGRDRIVHLYVSEEGLQPRDVKWSAQ